MKRRKQKTSFEREIKSMMRQGIPLDLSGIKNNAKLGKETSLEDIDKATKGKFKKLKDKDKKKGDK